MQRCLSGSTLSDGLDSSGSSPALPIERRRGSSTPRKSAIRSGDAPSFASCSTACSLDSSGTSVADQLTVPKVGNAVVCRRSLYTKQDADLHVLEGWTGIVTTASFSGDILVEWDSEGASRWVKANHLRHLVVSDDPSPDASMRKDSCDASNNATPRSILRRKVPAPAHGDCVLAVCLRKFASALRRSDGGRGTAPSPETPKTSSRLPAPAASPSVQQEALLRGGTPRRLDDSLGRFPSVFSKPSQ